MTLRVKFFIIVGVVATFIIFIILVLALGREKKVDEGGLTVVPLPTPKGVSTPTTPSPSVGTTPSSPEASQPSIVLDATALARSFAERFGSFSNQSNFENLRELKSLMTAAERVRVDRFIGDTQRTAAPNAPYYGITTRALETTVSGGSEQQGVLDLVVKTQRREVKGQEPPRIFYQNLVLVVKAVEGEWKVESATWK